MFIPFGCVSGKKAEPVGATIGYMEGFFYRMASAGGNSVFLEQQKFKSYVGVEPTNYIYQGMKLDYPGSGYVLITATTNAYDLNPSDTFLGAIGGNGWLSSFHVGPAPSPHRLVTSSKATGSIGSTNTAFISNVPNQNNISWTARFASNTQDVSILDDDYMGNGITNNLIADYSGAVAGETFLVVLGHQLPVTTPGGYQMVFSKNVSGSNTSAEPLAYNHKITVYSKVLNAGDISEGSGVFYTQGYTP